MLDLFAHGDYDDYWRQRGYAISDYYEQHADVPTLYLGGWYDSYARATCENYVALSRMKRSRQVLLMGPWTHGGWGVGYAGDVDFGPDGAARVQRPPPGLVRPLPEGAADRRWRSGRRCACS